jgi:hypothetical protein
VCQRATGIRPADAFAVALPIRTTGSLEESDPGCALIRRQLCRRARAGLGDGEHSLEKEQKQHGETPHRVYLGTSRNLFMTARVRKNQRQLLMAF